MKNRIYLDYNASTPIDPRVRDAIVFAIEKFGNPSSIHHEGREARSIVDQARVNIAKLIHCDHRRIVFTSGGTESNNIGIVGTAHANRNRGNHIITTAIEHSSVMKSCRQLEREGFDVTYLRPTSKGLIDPESLRLALTPKTILVSIMMANNEIGTIQPISDLAAIVHENHSIFHTDAIQALGKIPINVSDINADLISLSAHKIYGPKGVGALYCGSSVELEPLFRGGSHEQGLRPGTENVPGIHGFGVAAEILHYEGIPDLLPIRDKLESGLNHNSIEIVCGSSPRLPNTVNFYFCNWRGESLVMALDLEGIAVSNGSACSSGIIEPSHVIRSLGYNDDVARSVIRVSVGKFTQAAEIDRFLEVVHRLVQRVGTTLPKKASVNEARGE